MTEKTVFAGFDIHGAPAQSGPHLLVSGPTGVGKTRRVLGPSICLWDGPVVAVSSKEDFFELTAGTRRHAGPVYVMDLMHAHLKLPAGITQVRPEPVFDLTGPDSALDLASLLLRTGTLGAGTGIFDDASFWQTQAAMPLAALLWGASRLGYGMAWGVAMIAACNRPNEAGRAGKVA